MKNSDQSRFLLLFNDYFGIAKPAQTDSPKSFVCTEKECKKETNTNKTQSQTNTITITNKQHKTQTQPQSQTQTNNTNTTTNTCLVFPINAISIKRKKKNRHKLSITPTPDSEPIIILFDGEEDCKGKKKTQKTTQIHKYKHKNTI